MTKIMLVEDDKSLREIYGVRLLAEGYDIISAASSSFSLYTPQPASTASSAAFCGSTVSLCSSGSAGIHWSSPKTVPDACKM